eukprot:jgi/Bigna1/82012/fgenesh1_pg.86_\
MEEDGIIFQEDDAITRKHREREERWRARNDTLQPDWEDMLREQQLDDDNDSNNNNDDDDKARKKKLRNKKQQKKKLWRKKKKNKKKKKDDDYAYDDDDASSVAKGLKELHRRCAEIPCPSLSLSFNQRGGGGEKATAAAAAVDVSLTESEKRHIISEIPEVLLSKILSNIESCNSSNKSRIKVYRGEVVARKLEEESSLSDIGLLVYNKQSSNIYNNNIYNNNKIRQFRHHDDAHVINARSSSILSKKKKNMMIMVKDQGNDAVDNDGTVAAAAAAKDHDWNIGKQPSFRELLLNAPSGDEVKDEYLDKIEEALARTDFVKDNDAERSDDEDDTKGVARQREGHLDGYDGEEDSGKRRRSSGFRKSKIDDGENNDDTYHLNMNINSSSFHHLKSPQIGKEYALRKRNEMPRKPDMDDENDTPLEEVFSPRQVLSPQPNENNNDNNNNNVISKVISLTNSPPSDGSISNNKNISNKMDNQSLEEEEEEEVNIGEPIDEELKVARKLFEWKLERDVRYPEDADDVKDGFDPEVPLSRKESMLVRRSEKTTLFTANEWRFDEAKRNRRIRRMFQWGRVQMGLWRIREMRLRNNLVLQDTYAMAILSLACSGILYDETIKSLCRARKGREAAAILELRQREYCKDIPTNLYQAVIRTCEKQGEFTICDFIFRRYLQHLGLPSSLPNNKKLPQISSAQVLLLSELCNRSLTVWRNNPQRRQGSQGRRITSYNILSSDGDDDDESSPPALENAPALVIATANGEKGKEEEEEEEKGKHKRNSLSSFNNDEEEEEEEEDPDQIRRRLTNW